MPVSLKDVAARASVSFGTVSRALNDSPNSGIPKATRDRIRRLASEMGYHPSAIARGMRRSRLNIIGVSLHSMGSMAISNPYANQVLQGIVQAAHGAKYNVTLVQNPWNLESQSFEEFRSDLIDGMVVVAPKEEGDMLADMAARGVPVVAVSAPGELCGIPTVDVDNVRGTRLVLEHLLGLGHQRIGFLMWQNARTDAIVRRDTFIAVMSDAGLAVPPEYIQVDDPNIVADYGDLIAAPLDSDTHFEFYEPARNLLTLPNRPTAIFACDDRIARDVLLAARDLNISVPGQLSLVGFDDLPDAARLDPPLTTVRQPLAEMGAAATRLLLAVLAGDEAVAKTHWFEPELIVRKSTGPPPETI